MHDQNAHYEQDEHGFATCVSDQMCNHFIDPLYFGHPYNAQLVSCLTYMCIS